MKKPLIIIGIVLLVLAICVLPIFLILGTLSVVGVQATQKTYRETVRINDLRSFTDSIEGYYAKYGVYPKLSDSAVLTSIEKVSGKKDIVLDYPILNFLDPNTGANTEFSFKITAPGLMIYTGTGDDKRIKCKVSTVIEGNTLSASPDSWQIFYSTNGNAPQRYSLLTCTENGMITDYYGRMTD